MTDSLPLYRIIYADGRVGFALPWGLSREVWSWALEHAPAREAPVRVERVR